MNTDNKIILSPDSNNCESCWINNFSSFKNCSPQLRKQLLMNTKRKKFNKGENLIRTGELVGGVFCIQNGLVKVSKKGYGKKEFILWIGGKGDMLGLNSLIDDDPFSFSATAIDQVTACFILGADLKIALQSEPIISMRLMQSLCDKLTFIEQRITSISRKKIKQQCAEILLSIASKTNSERSDNMSINYSMSDLANLIGTTKSYLYKILSELSNQKIVSINSRKLCINNFQALSSIALGKKDAMANVNLS